jgi:gamma-glutamyltranspeptidase/glutathione hydrolase
MIGFPGGSSRSTPSGAADHRQPPVFADGGMVASAHPLVSAAAAEVLRRGGNAVDAAVCAGLTAAVTMPEMCGLGGDLFALVHAPAPAADASGGETVSVLGSGIAPRGATVEQFRAAGDGTRMPFRGPLAVAVPGMVDAYFALLDRWGSRPFAELAEPAISHAANGFPLTPLGAQAIAANAELLAGFPASRAIFLRDGDPPPAGSSLSQPDLARTLRDLAVGGSDVFYRGPIAKRIGQAITDAGGALTADDLADHRTDFAAPIRTTYRGYTVYQTGLPTQGMILLEALNIAECADLASLGVGSAAGVHLLVEAKKLAYADRLGYAGDPAFVRTPLDAILSKRWAAERYARIDADRAATDVPPGDHRPGDTTYLCVVDRQGMMVSLIQSVSAAFGCGMVAGDTGVVLNNRAGRGFTLEEGHPNVFAPGKKTMHTLNCYLLADPAGRPALVGGTPGGDGQPQWNLQALVGLIDGGLDVQAAIEQPRWTSWPGTDPSTLPNPFQLRAEDRLGEQILADLAARGHEIVVQGPWDGGGAAQAIARDPDSGAMVGGADPRAESVAVGI